MRGDLPEDILEEILNLKKDRTARRDLSELEMRGKEAFEAALGRLKENGCLLACGYADLYTQFFRKITRGVQTISSEKLNI